MVKLWKISNVDIRHRGHIRIYEIISVSPTGRYTQNEVVTTVWSWDKCDKPLPDKLTSNSTLVSSTESPTWFFLLDWAQVAPPHWRTPVPNPEPRCHGWTSAISHLFSTALRKNNMDSVKQYTPLGMTLDFAGKLNHLNSTNLTRHVTE